VLDGHVAPLVEGLLARHGLARGAVDGWAVHPGGPRILQVIQSRLGLSDGEMAASRQVLAEHGNCSSPTVLMILEALRPTAPERIVALAFGPGLTLYAALFARV
jgi:predicted naringenin-chalcone synthase